MKRDNSAEVHQTFHITVDRRVEGIHSWCNLGRTLDRNHRFYVDDRRCRNRSSSTPLPVRLPRRNRLFYRGGAIWSFLGRIAQLYSLSLVKFTKNATTSNSRPMAHIQHGIITANDSFINLNPYLQYRRTGRVYQPDRPRTCETFLI